eukprot:g30601.t1
MPPDPPDDPADACKRFVAAFSEDADADDVQQSNSSAEVPAAQRGPEITPSDVNLEASEAPEDEAEKDGAEEEPPQEDAPLEEVMDEPDEAPGLSQIHCEVEEDHVEPWLDRGRHVQTARGFGGSRPKSFLRHAEDSTLQLMLDLSEDQEPGGPCRGAKGHVFEPDPSIEAYPELPKPDAIEVFENPPESPAKCQSAPGAFVPDSLLDEVEFVGVCEAAPLAPSAPPAAVVAEAAEAPEPPPADAPGTAAVEAPASGCNWGEWSR